MTSAGIQRRFEGQVAIITGASSGIGLATAQRLASEGASLILTAHPRDKERLDAAAAAIRDDLTAVHAVALDQADPSAGDSVVSEALAAYGKLNIVIGNAGASHFNEFPDARDEQWHQMIDINLSGNYYLLSRAARAMPSDGSGAIVVTASTAAFMGDELQMYYNTAKAGLVGLTRSLAVALARFGIRVNAVAPGFVDVPHKRGSGPFVEHSHRMIPMRRSAETSEIASVIAFLASSDASYVTGQTIVADGGLLAGFSYPREIVIPNEPT